MRDRTPLESDTNDSANDLSRKFQYDRLAYLPPIAHHRHFRAVAA